MRRAAAWARGAAAWGAVAWRAHRPCRRLALTAAAAWEHVTWPPTWPPLHLLERHAAHPALRFGGGAGRRQPWQQLPRVGRRGVARGDEDSDDGTTHGGAVAALSEACHAAEAGAAHAARRVACRHEAQLARHDAAGHALPCGTLLRRQSHPHARATELEVEPNRPVAPLAGASVVGARAAVQKGAAAQQAAREQPPPAADARAHWLPPLVLPRPHEVTPTLELRRLAGGLQLCRGEAIAREEEPHPTARRHLQLRLHQPRRPTSRAPPGLPCRQCQVSAAPLTAPSIKQDQLPSRVHLPWVLTPARQQGRRARLQPCRTRRGARRGRRGRSSVGLAGSRAVRACVPVATVAVPTALGPLARRDVSGRGGGAGCRQADQHVAARRQWHLGHVLAARAKRQQVAMGAQLGRGPGGLREPEGGSHP
eukprot:scaffold2429_cov52-Phaeocystis_antarctica.AAC.4